MTHKTAVREQARKLVEMGYPNCYVADVVQVAHETVRRWSRDWRGEKPELTPLAEKRLRLLVQKGYSCAVIGRQLGIYPRKLKRLVKERGLEFASYKSSCALSVALKRDNMQRWHDDIHKKAERDLAERIQRGEFVY